MSNVLKVFNRVGKQTILDFARKGGCEFIRIDLRSDELDKRAQSKPKVCKGMKNYHVVMQVDYNSKVFNLMNI